MVVRSIAADPRLAALRQRAAQGRGVVHVCGLWGASARLAAASVAADRDVLYVTAHLEGADQARDDLELFLGRPCEVFPAWEAIPGEGAGSGEIQAERLRVCGLLRRAGCRADGRDALRGRRHPGTVLVAPIQSLMQPVPDSAALDRNTLQLSTAGAHDGAAGRTPDSILEWAIERGFERLDVVESPGDVARRGDLVDLFVPGHGSPFRIQFDGERIESIRRIDIGTQRSTEALDFVEFAVLPSTARAAGDSRETLLGYLPSDSIVVLDHPAEIQELGRTIYARLGEPAELFETSKILSLLAERPQVQLWPFAGTAAQGDDVFEFDTASLSRFEGSATDAVEELSRLASDHEVVVVCDNEGERSRLEEILGERPAGRPESIRTELGMIHRGFVWSATKTAVIAHHEIFHRQRPRRRLRRVEAARPIESWTELQVGDHVVHAGHGIGVYGGLQRLRKGDSNQFEEFLKVEFADGAAVQVPTSQIDLVQKYIGAGGRKPTLSTLGGRRWSNTKEKVSEAVSDLAAALLRLQAVRAEVEGTAYPADTEWQREFEASFLYEETEDQLRVAGEVREDLRRPRPMDRLICGDVGYGKTELAMRAAFKVVEYGRQVAVLVPTTVLAEQHFETFQERMADYPFKVACLSRFRSGSEQKSIVEQVRRGQADVVIGTHRLLSKDVRFADLGLVIIDEEQRFGVEHKEKLRSIREGGRADADGDGDPADAAHVVDGYPRHLRPADPARGPPVDRHAGSTVRAKPDPRRDPARDEPRRAGLFRAQLRAINRRHGRLDS